MMNWKSTRNEPPSNTPLLLFSPVESPSSYIVGKYCKDKDIFEDENKQHVLVSFWCLINTPPELLKMEEE